MSEIKKLDAAEMFHIALEAANRNDHAQAIALLKDLLEEDQATQDLARATYFLGAEYAQVGMYDRAVEHMEKALEVDAMLHIARFQLGLLHLTSGRVEMAREVWAGLATLDESDANACLNFFRQGLEALVEDRFVDCRELLMEGMARNKTNVALNVDMQKMLDALPAQPTMSANAIQEDKQTESVTEDHLFLSAYRGSGKTH